MKKFLFLMLFAAMFVGCKSDVDEAPLVTEVSLSPASGVVAPGDKVALTAQGLEANDEIMLRVSWPLGDVLLPEGFADAIRGVVTARTATGITFLVPGGWPAGRLDVKLFRGGKIMLLGSLSIADGQPPKEFLLYSLTHSDADETVIRRIDTATGAQTEVKTLGVADRIRCAVNTPGSNIIGGLLPTGGIGFYDLTMRYGSTTSTQKIVAAGVFHNQVLFMNYSGGLLYPVGMPATRTNYSPGLSSAWALPEGIQPEMLSAYPFVSVYAESVLLSARRAPGTYVPVLLLSPDRSTENALKGDDVLADAMIPVPILEMQPDKTSTFTPSFFVSNGGKTELRPLLATALPLSIALGEPLELPEIPGTVLSVASCQTGATAQDIYLLCNLGAKRQIQVLSLPSGVLRTLPGEFTCDEIVLAR